MDPIVVALDSIEEAAVVVSPDVREPVDAVDCVGCVFSWLDEASLEAVVEIAAVGADVGDVKVAAGVATGLFEVVAAVVSPELCVSTFVCRGGKGKDDKVVAGTAVVGVTDSVGELLGLATVAPLVGGKDAVLDSGWLVAADVEPGLMAGLVGFATDETETDVETRLEAAGDVGAVTNGGAEVVGTGEVDREDREDELADVDTKLLDVGLMIVDEMLDETVGTEDWLVVLVVKHARSVMYVVWHSVTSCRFPRRPMTSMTEQDTAVLRHVLTGTGGVVTMEVLVVVELVVKQAGIVAYDVWHSTDSCLFPRRPITSTVEQETAVLRHVLMDTGGVVTVGEEVGLEEDEFVDVVKQAGTVA